MIGVKHILISLICAATLVGIGGCQRSEGPLERAGKAVDETVEDAGDKMHDAGHDMKDMVDGD